MWKLLRYALILGNGVFFIVGLYEVNKLELFSFLVFSLLILNITYLFFYRIESDSDWFSLFMKRKRMEEEKRIKELES